MNSEHWVPKSGLTTINNPGPENKKSNSKLRKSGHGILKIWDPKIQIRTNDCKNPGPVDQKANSKHRKSGHGILKI